MLFTPPPPVTNCHTSDPLPPLERDFMDGPYDHFGLELKYLLQHDSPIFGLKQLLTATVMRVVDDGEKSLGG